MMSDPQFELRCAFYRGNMLQLASNNVKRRPTFEALDLPRR
jgi:hypothetical protein